MKTTIKCRTLNFPRLNIVDNMRIKKYCRKLGYKFQGTTVKNNNDFGFIQKISGTSFKTKPIKHPFYKEEWKKELMGIKLKGLSTKDLCERNNYSLFIFWKSNDGFRKEKIDLERVNKITNLINVLTS